MLPNPNTSAYPEAPKALPRRGLLEILISLDELNDRLGEFREEFVIIGGANLVLRRMRLNTPDIDLLVSDNAFEAMQQFESAQIKQPPKRALDRGANNTSVWLDTEWTRAPISAATEMGDGYFPISYVKYVGQPLETLHGHRLTSLDEIWGSKAALQRPKDMPDLERIVRETGHSMEDLSARTFVGPLIDS